MDDRLPPRAVAPGSKLYLGNPVVVRKGVPLLVWLSKDSAHETMTVERVVQLGPVEFVG